MKIQSFVREILVYLIMLIFLILIYAAFIIPVGRVMLQGIQEAVNGFIQNSLKNIPK